MKVNAVHACVLSIHAKHTGTWINTTLPCTPLNKQKSITITIKPYCMRIPLFLVLIATSVSIALTMSCTNSSGKEPQKPTALSNDSLIKRGAYLVLAGGCDDCHSPKIMTPTGPAIDTSLRLSGFPSNRPIPAFDSNIVKKEIILLAIDGTAAAGPWGLSFAANLTSDATGAGSWPVENFINALRHGKFKGHENGRPLLPPMPWQNIGQLTDEDLTAIHAFLHSIKPVENVPPAPRQFADLK